MYVFRTMIVLFLVGLRGRAKFRAQITSRLVPDSVFTFLSVDLDGDNYAVRLIATRRVDLLPRRYANAVRTSMSHLQLLISVC